MSALKHLRVVDYGAGVAGPFAARLFADLGADVIKVEPPGGDPVRRLGPFADDRQDLEGGGLFHFVNAGKSSVVADLDVPADLEWLHALLASADVFVESAAGPDRERWGLGAAALAARHPHLVVVSVSAYGRQGPWANRAAVDLTVQAVTALPVAIGWPDRPPLTLPFNQAGYLAGFHAAAAALCAVYERQRSGSGQGVEISEARVLAHQVGAMYLVIHKRGLPWLRAGNRLKGTLYPTAFFEAADGHVCIVTLHGRQWRRWIELMGTPAWSQNERSLDSYGLGTAGEDDPVDIAFRAWLKQFTRAQLVELGNANDLIVGPVNTIDQVLRSPQLAFRDGWGRVRIGESDVSIPKPGYLFGETPTDIRSAGPRLDGDRAALRALPPVSASHGGAARERGALSGLRVLDFGWNWAGPMAGQFLADMGAEVIRIETTLRQDNMRAFEYASDFFCQNNRSKMSATFNIADPRGAELVRKLAEQSDVVMDNFAAGVMAKNGLGYADLARHNPAIVVVSMSMAGQAGPERHLRGFASVSSGYAGLEAMVGYPDENRTTGFMAFGLGDATQSIQAVVGTLAALIHRARTGQGQLVDMGQISSQCASLGEPMLDFQLNGRLAGLRGNLHPEHSPHGIYPVGDGARWLALAVTNEHEWASLCRVMGRPDLLADDRLSQAAGRRRCATVVDAAIAAWLAGSERDAAVELLGAAGIPAAPVLELAERASHPVFSDGELMTDHQGTGFPGCRIYNTPWRFSATPPRISRPTPAIGEHNDYVYRQLLGLSDAEIERLVSEKVLL